MNWPRPVFTRYPGRGIGRVIGLASVLVLATACQDTAGTHPLTPTPHAAASSAGTTEYIVVLKNNVTDVVGAANKIAVAYSTKPQVVWQSALKGFVIPLSSASISTQIARRSNVAYVVPNGPIFTTGRQSPVPSWGLDRIDQVSLPLDQGFTSPNTASNVHAYIVDTGILTTHSDFGGRATVDANFASGPATDCNGHGSHVAGTVGGSLYGVAKDVKLHGLRVFDCAGTGTYAAYISALDWLVAGNVQLPAVMNASLSGGANLAADQATRAVAAAGVFVSVAAGNNGGDACSYSPANLGGSLDGVLTVMASDIGDSRAWFSNSGKCADVYGPGVSITSAWIGSNSATATLNGTSMAAPHLAGVAALYLSANPTASPATTERALKAVATANAIKGNPLDTPNLLGFAENPAPPPPPPPSGREIDLSSIACATPEYRAPLPSGVVIDGMEFTNPAGPMGAWCQAATHYSGRTSLFPGVGYSTLTMRAFDHSPFTIASISLAPLYFSQSIGATVTFTGTLVTGGTVTQTCSFPPNQGAPIHHPCAFNAGMANLASLSWRQGGNDLHQFSAITIR